MEWTVRASKNSLRDPSQHGAKFGWIEKKVWKFSRKIACDFDGQQKLRCTHKGKKEHFNYRIICINWIMINFLIFKNLLKLTHLTRINWYFVRILRKLQNFISDFTAVRQTWHARSQNAQCNRIYTGGCVQELHWYLILWLWKCTRK